MIRLVLFFALLLFVAGCAGGIGVDNGCFEVSFVDPAGGGELGCRFFRAGWIASLRPAGSDESIFHTRPIFDFHPAFGCAQEFLPDLELADGELLKIGVGIFRPHPRNYFRSRVLTAFPWESRVEETKESWVLSAHQSCEEREGYAYELTLTVTIRPFSPEILWRQELRNTGSRRIDGNVYMHPFFHVRNGFEEWWYRLPGRTPQSVAGSPVEYISNEAGGVAAGTRCLAVGIASDRLLCKSVFWKNDSGCFAVEPFIPLGLAPGEQLSWEWRLTVDFR